MPPVVTGEPSTGEPSVEANPPKLKRKSIAIALSVYLEIYSVISARRESRWSDFCCRARPK